MFEEGGDGWGPWRVLPRLMGGAVAVPVVMGFVALGAVVLVIRSMREVMRETWALVPGWRPVSQLASQRDARSLEHRTDSAA